MLSSKLVIVGKQYSLILWINSVVLLGLLLGRTVAYQIYKSPKQNFIGTNTAMAASRLRIDTDIMHKQMIEIQLLHSQYDTAKANYKGASIIWLLHHFFF